MRWFALAGMLLVTPAYAGDLTCPECSTDNGYWRSNIDERPIMADMPNWLRKRYPITRRRLRR